MTDYVPVEVRIPFSWTSKDGKHPDRVTVVATRDEKTHDAYQRVEFGGFDAQVRVDREWIRLVDLIRCYQNTRQLKEMLVLTADAT